MTQTAHTTRPVTDLIPSQRTPAETPAPVLAAPAESFTTIVRRAFAVARGLRTLRPVPARAQEGYGESDGQ